MVSRITGRWQWLCGSLAWGCALAVGSAHAQTPVAYVMLANSTEPQHVSSMEIVLEPLTRKRTSPVVNALASSHDGRFLAAAGDDHAIRIIDVASGNTVRTIGAHSDWIQALAFSRDGQQLYSAGDDGRVLRWRHEYPVQGKEVVQLPYAIRSLSIASEVGLLAIGGFSNEIVVWDLNQARIRHRLKCDCGDQRCVRFSPDGKQLLCGGRDGELRVWNSLTGEETASFHEHRGRVYTAAFSADGQRITSAADDRQLIQYDLQSGQVVLKRELARAKLMSLCMINDDLVAVAGADNNVHLYDALADEVVAQLIGHQGTVAEMTPCGNLLASGSFDTTIRLWDLESIDRTAVEAGKPVYAPLKMDDSLRIR